MVTHKPIDGFQILREYFVYDLSRTPKNIQKKHIIWKIKSFSFEIRIFIRI